MTIRITLYAHTFMHDNVKHMSTSIMLWVGNDIRGSIETGGYVKDGRDVFTKAMEIARMADQQKRLLEALGHEVEMDHAFNTTASIHDTLVDLYGEVM